MCLRDSVTGQELHLSLLSLHGASTDFDLTGQVLWPSSELLARFLFENRYSPPHTLPQECVACYRVVLLAIFNIHPHLGPIMALVAAPPY